MSAGEYQGSVPSGGAGADSAGDPRVTVLLAVCNGEQFLREQVLSVLQQAGAVVSVVVSLDPSIDGSEQVLLGLAAQDQRITLLPLLSASGGAARNFFRLLRDAKLNDADYVCLCDQDDIWLPGRLQRAIGVMRAAAASAYSSNVIAFWPDGRERVIVKSDPQRRWDFWFEAAGPGCTYVLSGDFALNLQKRLHDLGTEVQTVARHDWLIYAFARVGQYRWVIDDCLAVRYRQHGANEVGANVGWRSQIARARQFWSGWWLDQSLLLARVVARADDPFILRWSGRGRVGLLWLALNAHHCRRRRRDALFFGASCLLLALKGWQPK